jgi:hypothetical protein
MRQMTSDVSEVKTVSCAANTSKLRELGGLAAWALSWLASWLAGCGSSPTRRPHEAPGSQPLHFSSGLCRRACACRRHPAVAQRTPMPPLDNVGAIDPAHPRATMLVQSCAGGTQRESAVPPQGNNCERWLAERADFRHRGTAVRLLISQRHSVTYAAPCTNGPSCSLGDRLAASSRAPSPMALPHAARTQRTQFTVSLLSPGQLATPSCRAPARAARGFPPSSSREQGMRAGSKAGINSRQYTCVAHVAD